MRGTASIFLPVLLIPLATLLQAQGTPPPSPLTMVSREGRRPVPTTIVGNQELIALDEVAALFQVAVREDTLAGGLTLTYRGRTVVVSTNQPMASVAGRLVALPSAPVRSGQRWLVPVELLPRALAPIYDARIELRRPSRLLLVGDVRVPRVTARIDAPGPPTRATVEIAPAAPVTVTTEAGRVVLRVDADALDLNLPGDGAALIDQFRAGEQPTAVAVVLDGRAGAARAIPSEAGGVTRVALEVAAAATADAAPAPPPAPAPLPAAVAAPAFLFAPRPVLLTIVVDPGHGGDDIGARGAGGAEEKRITLELSRRLRMLIETRLGIRVILTRDDDRRVSLDDRAAVANNNKADLFLSLHLNAAPVPDVAGAEVLYLRLDDEGEEARRAAETESVSLPVLGGARRTLDVLRWDLAQARHVDASTVLATVLEEELRAQITMSPRPRLQVPLRVLTGVNMPAALIEMAYLTNPADERRAQSDDFQAGVAQGIYNAVLRFRSYLEAQRQP
ncbi:MAG: N-acetylmuramoyl-L-alanine amidase [Acidobacteria bacterium]|nr:N-acetylmuramoyl-L-alanine amidase [Acidobacteriota bacterium]